MQIGPLQLTSPANWETHVNVTLLEPPGDEGVFRTNIQVGTIPLPEDFDLEATGAHEVEVLGREVDGAEIDTQSVHEVAGREVFELAYQFIAGEATYVQVQFFLTLAEQRVTLTGTAVEAREEELREWLREVLASLEL